MQSKPKLAYQINWVMKQLIWLVELWFSANWLNIKQTNHQLKHIKKKAQRIDSMDQIDQLYVIWAGSMNGNSWSVSVKHSKIHHNQKACNQYHNRTESIKQISHEKKTCKTKPKIPTTKQTNKNFPRTQMKTFKEHKTPTIVIIIPIYILMVDICSGTWLKRNKLSNNCYNLILKILSNCSL